MFFVLGFFGVLGFCWLFVAWFFGFWFWSCWLFGVGFCIVLFFVLLILDYKRAKTQRTAFGPQTI